MRREKHIKMIIRVEGTCAVDAMNFTDATCMWATHEIVRALAGRTIKEQLKPEARIGGRQAHSRTEKAR